MALWELTGLVSAVREVAVQLKRLADQREPVTRLKSSPADHIIVTDPERIALKQRLYDSAKSEGLSRAEAKAKVRNILKRTRGERV